MKKLLYVITLLFVSFLLVGNVSAKTTPTGLVEAVAEEIETFDGQSGYEEYVSLMKKANLSDYVEDDNKVNVYIFRGNTCWHCLDEISWIASKTAEYGKYFNIITYEVWADSNNNKLMSAVAKQLGQTAGGVPFTVIGNKTWSGFSEEMGEEMLNTVMDIYNSGNVKTNDISQKINLEDATVIGNDNKESSNSTLIICLLAVVFIGGVVAIYFISKSK